MFGAVYFGNRYFGGRYFGKEGLTVPGYYFGRYNGPYYFGKRYFGQQGDSDPFEASVSNTLALTGTLGYSSPTIVLTAQFEATVSTGLSLTGALSANATPSLEYANDFVAGAPLEFSMSGALSISGVSVSMGFVPTNGRYFGGSYFGAYYFGPRYWGTEIEFSTAVTTGLSMSGAMTYAAGAEQILIASISNTLAFDGAMTFDDLGISYETPPPVIEDIYTGGFIPSYIPRKKRERKELEFSEVTPEQIQVSLSEEQERIRQRKEFRKAERKAQTVMDELRSIYSEQDALKKAIEQMRSDPKFIDLTDEELKLILLVAA